MATPQTDELVEAGADSQNEYITKLISLCRCLEEALEDEVGRPIMVFSGGDT